MEVTWGYFTLAQTWTIFTYQVVNAFVLMTLGFPTMFLMIHRLNNEQNENVLSLGKSLIKIIFQQCRVQYSGSIWLALTPVLAYHFLGNCLPQSALMIFKAATYISIILPDIDIVTRTELFSISFWVQCNFLRWKVLTLKRFVLKTFEMKTFKMKSFGPEN